MKNITTQRFRQFLQIAGFTQSSFARKFNLSPQQVSGYANGRLRMSNIQDYMYEIGCSLDWLYNGEGSPFAENKEGKTLAKQYSLKINMSVKFQF